MALPNLSALRLAEAERRVDTNEWVQYDPSLQVVVDNEDLRECPICAERFAPGDWLWKTNREQGGAYYTPREYWKALKSRNGVDPMVTMDSGGTTSARNSFSVMAMSSSPPSSG